MKISQQKNAKTMKKYSKNKFISDLPSTLIFSRYETGTTCIFLGLNVWSSLRKNIFLGFVVGQTPAFHL
jgi:hypothetical protein